MSTAAADGPPATPAEVPAPGPRPAARLGDRFATAAGWGVATVVDAWHETATARTLVLDAPGWPGHRAGQHVDLRLTADDGYTASRAYSVSAPWDPEHPGQVQVTVQRVMGGEVSTYLVDDLPVGAGIEVRGPVGGWFVWEPGTADGAPVLLLAGGSGVTPLAAMVRARRAAGDRTPFRVLYSVRMPTDAMFLDEVTGQRLDGVDGDVWFTRAAPPDAPRAPARIGLRDLAHHGWPAALEPVCYVCGPTGFVEAMTRMLLVLGHDSRAIRAERFGPSTD